MDSKELELLKEEIKTNLDNALENFSYIKECL